MSLSLITLGSTRCSELADTVLKSHEFCTHLVDEWIFVLYSPEEVANFSSYLSSYQISLDCFNVKVLSDSGGITSSLNSGVRQVTSDWSIFVHSGDHLEPVSYECYKYINNVLRSSLYSFHVFGTWYSREGLKVGKSSHTKSKLYKHLLPWIPHESTIVRTSIYAKYIYDTDFKSAMDYEFFLRLFLSRERYMLHDVYITNYSLGGTSSNLYASCMEIKRALIKSNFAKIILLTRFFSGLLFVYVYASKLLFSFFARHLK